MLAVQGMIDDLKEPGLDFGLVAVADRLKQQFAERTVVEGELAEHVEDLAAQRLPLFVELFQEAEIDFAFARILGDEIPQVADFGLADAMNAPESLFQAIGIPGQVVIDHQVGALQVDALAGRVGGDEDFDFLVVLERLLGLLPLFPADAAVDDDHGFRLADQGANPLRKVIQRVAVLGENDELAAMPMGVKHLGVVLQQSRKLVPFAVGAGLPDAKRDAFQVEQLGDFCPQFRDRAGRRCLVDNLFLGVFEFGIGGVVEVVEVVGNQGRQARVDVDGNLRSALQQLLFPEPFFQAFAAAAERLVDRLGRRCQTALQDRQGEADGSLPAFVFEGLGAVELLADVFGDFLVELCFGIRKRIVNGVGATLGKERRAVKFKKLAP